MALTLTLFAGIEGLVLVEALSLFGRGSARKTSAGCR
jgi:hypothetical protein